MGRKPGPDAEKLKRIIETLRNNPKGLWSMEISRKTKISKSTVHRYLTTHLKDKVKEERSFSGLVKLFTLKGKRH